MFGFIQSSSVSRQNREYKRTRKVPLTSSKKSSSKAYFFIRASNKYLFGPYSLIRKITIKNFMFYQSSVVRISMCRKSIFLL